MQSERRTCWLIGFAVGLLVLAIYGQSVQFDFVNYDDNRSVTSNQLVRQGLTLEGVRWAFAPGDVLDDGNWIPLTRLSFMLDAQLFGERAGGFHFTNVALHALNAIVLFWVLRLLTGATLRSGVAAAFFAAHPLHVESVAWVSERKDLLCTFCGFLAIAGYVYYTREERTAARRRWYCCALLALVASLMSKQMLVTLPFLLLLLDAWPLGRTRWMVTGSTADLNSGEASRRPGTASRLPTARLVLEKLPFALVAVLFSAIAFAAQQQTGTIATLVERPLATRVANALVAYVTYLRKAFWPSDLAVFYPYPEAGIPFSQTLLCGIILLGISGLAAWQAKARPYLLVGWLWYLGTLVPVIGIVQIGDQALADRYTYIPLIGVNVALVWLVSDLTRSFMPLRKVAWATAGALLFVFATTAFSQAGHWRSSVALFEHALAVGAESSLAHNNLGFALEAEGRADDALAHYERALVIDPDDALTHSNLGSWLQKSGRTEQALGHFQTAVQLDPEMSLARSNLGGLLARLGRRAAAIQHLQEAVRLDPSATEAHYNLAVVLSGLGKSEEAIKHNRIALDLNPDYAVAHNNLANELARAGQIEAAIVHVREAIRLDPLFAQAHYNLGALLLRQPNEREVAWTHLKEAARLDPAIARVLSRTSHEGP